MGQPYADQLAAKQRRCVDLLRQWDPHWCAPVPSAESGFRNRAKMAVSGTVTHPRLGIVDAVDGGVDLRDCGLHEPGIVAALPALADFVTQARLAPYSVRDRRGELKFVLVTQSPSGELMVRFVLRSRESLDRVRKHGATLVQAIPQLAVLSVNLQPEHKAVVEGAEEIVLSERSTLPMVVNGRTLRLRPQSFFQTNTAVAAALYRQAQEWTDDIDPHVMWDLYCGVGGFALHLARAGRRVLGVETSAAAVADARLSAADAGLSADFEVGDATEFALGGSPAPDLVVVNPPRRGLGVRLCAWLNESTVRRVLYSSCNVDSLVADLELMPGFLMRQAQLFDMFPHTRHAEVLVLLERRG